MKTFRFWTTVLVLSLFLGCMSGKKEPQTKIYRLTDISYVEKSTNKKDDNTRIYHIRYPKTAMFDFDIPSAIMMIEGVQRVVPMHYEVVVLKSKVYGWEEIQPKIVKIIKEFEECVPYLMLPKPEPEQEDDEGDLFSNS